MTTPPFFRPGIDIAGVRPTTPTEPVDSFTEMQREQAQRIVSRAVPGVKTRRRLVDLAEAEAPTLYIVSPTLSRSPVLQDAQRALLTAYDGDAFDYLEGVNTILDSTMIPEFRAPDVMDRLIRFSHVLRLEDV